MQSRTTDTEMNNHKTGSSGATFTILNYPRNPSLDPSVNSGQKILFRNSASFLEKKIHTNFPNSKSVFHL